MECLCAGSQVPDEPKDERLCLIHGGLHTGQILLGGGIIDWDELSVWDPAYDLMLVYSMIPPENRPHFWSSYGDFDEGDRARFIALSYGLAILAQAVDGGQERLSAEAAFGLNNALIL